MQDVTDLPFMKVMHRYGGPDIYVTEYFRVHPDSTLHPWILRSIDENPSGRPIFAQMIGSDIPKLVSTARELLQHNVAGIDLNLGCPAPVVCRKDAGGGLLRDLPMVDRILGALRDGVDGRFTVKTRIGYDGEEEFDSMLRVFAKHGIDSLAIHGRTVRERYATPVHPDRIRQAVETMPCPVMANGNVVDVATGAALHEQTDAAGLMIGRGAIRNPWIFRQLREHWAGDEIFQPTRRDLLAYIELLFEETAAVQRNFEPSKHVTRLKKYLKYIAQQAGGDFDREICRVRTPEEFFEVCRRHLDCEGELPAKPPVNSRLFCGFEDLVKSPSTHD